MRPLLWKEMHALRAWLLAGIALTGALELLLRTRVFEGSFAGMWMEALMPLAAAGVAIGLAAGQIARERHGRTLDFLLARPVPAGAIVWSKFLAGSVAVALLVACIVALGYADPQFKSDTGLQLIREQVSVGQLLVTLLPRFWFLYALALCFSVLVDRSAKAAALAGAVAITVASAAVAWAELAPFSGFVYWLPFFDGTGGLVDAARSPALSAMTGLVYSCASILLTAVSAALLKRSPERYLGNRGLALAAAGVIAVATASAYGAANRLPSIAPVGSWEFRGTGESDPAGILASGNLVAVTLEHGVRILDFTQPARPKQIADVAIHLWSSSEDWSIQRAAMAGDTVFLTGQRKQLPVDEVQIAIVTPAGLADTISLGPVRPGDYTSAPMPAGGVLFVAITRDRVCSLLAFDRQSKNQVASLSIDRMRPPLPGREEGSPPVRMLSRGAYLYVSSPSWLTTVDINDPARPHITSQLPVLPKVSFLYGFPRPLAWQDGRLFEIRIFPESLASYNLSDPAHPVAGAELTYHYGMVINGGARALYRPWRSGVMEFRAAGNDLQAERYLRCEGAVSALATTTDTVFALTARDEHKHPGVYAFRTAR